MAGISIGDRVTDIATITDLLPTFIIEICSFQVELSKNKDAICFPFRFRNLLNSV